MWLMTRFGFFSVVQKDGESHLTIRSRTRGDLDRLRGHYLPQLGPGIAHAGTDYPWRAVATTEDLASALTRIARDINYSNFKEEVSLSLGKERAHRYSKVWAALAGMPEDLPEPHPAPQEGLPWSLETPSGKAIAYGGVIMDPSGRILLREVANHYDGYVWTFSKGRPRPGEAPRDTALRETVEETGVNGRILCPIPGSFAGGTTINYFFLMMARERDTNLNFCSDETAGLRWVSPNEARQLIEQTTNAKGRIRDFQILDAALSCITPRVPSSDPITLREDWITKPMPSQRADIALSLNFTHTEMAGIHRGHLPHEMEDKWFLFYEDGVLHMHRSWTGNCIYRVYFIPTDTGWQARTAEVNRHPGQYHETSLDADIRLIEALIHDLLLKG